MNPLRSLPALSAVLLSACSPWNWTAGAGMLAPERQVAAALGDPVSEPEKFDPGSLPRIEQPRHVRPCCAFGMDLGVEVGGRIVLGFKLPNVQGVEDLGRHEYGSGAISFDPDPLRLATVEKNGLVYTCRGGFVDTAHVRDNADLTLFLGMRIAAVLPGPAEIAIDGDGSARRVVLKAVPPAVMQRLGRREVATRLAQYAVYRLSVFHEVATWYGLETTRGYSERVSAFSPEDFYSNALGIRMAGGIVGMQLAASRREWDAAMDAWLPKALGHLRALPRDLGRRAMKDLDGLWWDSTRVLPEDALVTRRNFSLANPVVPWRLADAARDAEIEAACAGSEVLPLAIPDSLGDGLPIADVVTVEVTMGSWAKALPFADPKSRRVVDSELPRVMEAARAEAEQIFGAGFDHPSGEVDRPNLPEPRP